MSKKTKAVSVPNVSLKEADPATVDAEFDGLTFDSPVKEDQILMTGVSREEPAAAPARQAHRSNTTRARRAQIKVDTLTIEKGVDPPLHQSKGRPSPWVAFLQKMAVGESVNIPDTTVAKVGYVRKIGKDLGLNFVARADGDGVRLWRIESESSGASDGL